MSDTLTRTEHVAERSQIADLRALIVGVALLGLVTATATGAGERDASAVATAAPAHRPLIHALRRQTGTDLHAASSDHFLLLHPAGDDAHVQRTLAVLEATRQCFFKAFSEVAHDEHDAPAPLVWVVFNTRDQFTAYALAADMVEMGWSQAYYSARTNRVAFLDERTQPIAPRVVSLRDPQRGAADDTELVMPVVARGVDRRLQQMTHEAVHQIAFNSGLQRRGVMYPLWASEGLATNFEADAFGRVGPDYLNGYRLKRFGEVVAGRRLLDVSTLIAMTRVPVADDQAVDDAYAQAWAFFHFLYTTRRDDLGRYYARLTAARPGFRSPGQLRAEFVELFGPIEPVQAAWDRHCRRLHAALDAPSDRPARAHHAARHP